MEKEKIKRFRDKINAGKKDECWNWTGGVDRVGYGMFRVGYSEECRGGKKMAHRLMWELVKGPIPPKMKVLHKCDNRKCCNPNHLFLGTQKDNVHDMLRKGRGYLQKKILSKEDIKKIKSMLIEGSSQEFIAKKIGISQATISRINLGEHWLSNNHDILRKGRSKYSKQVQKIFNEKEIEKIRRMLDEGKSQEFIAWKVGTSQGTISRIKLGKY